MKTLIFAHIRFIPKFERRALNETGVGTKWPFSTFKPLYLGNAQTLLLITNRKSHRPTRF